MSVKLEAPIETLLKSIMRKYHISGSAGINLGLDYEDIDIVCLTENAKKCKEFILDKYSEGAENSIVAIDCPCYENDTLLRVQLVYANITYDILITDHVETYYRWDLALAMAHRLHLVDKLDRKYLFSMVTKDLQSTLDFLIKY